MCLCREEDTYASILLCYVLKRTQILTHIDTERFNTELIPASPPWGRPGCEEPGIHSPYPTLPPAAQISLFEPHLPGNPFSVPRALNFKIGENWGKKL